MPRYFLEISYLGTNYCGWQSQPNGISIQSCIESALTTVLRQQIEIVGSGRTDAGVHCRSQFAHFDVKNQPPTDLQQRLNGILPPDIAIMNIYLPTNQLLHARFDALTRTYQYFISKQKDPFLQHTAWVLTFPLDTEIMQKACELLLQTTDFTSFAKIHSNNKTTLCKIHNTYWQSNPQTLVFQITANRFLRGMVRAIVGTLVDVGTNKINLTEFQSIIDKKDRKYASMNAPAKGLFLREVTYPAGNLDKL